MSEWDAFVSCTCFQDGKASTPPHPIDELEVNEFGIVTLKASALPGDDPDDLWDWREGLTTDETRFGTACPHESMRLVHRIFYWPGSRSHTPQYPLVEHLVATGDFPVLGELIYRPEGNERPSGGIWMRACEAEGIHVEVSRLARVMPPGDPAQDDHFVAALLELAAAAMTTGNPVVVHYNGLVDGAW